MGRHLAHALEDAHESAIAGSKGVHFPSAPDHMWTFAYGANVGQEKLLTANIHPTATLPGSLPGHRLVFNPSLAVGPDEPAFADITDLQTQGKLSPVRGALHLVSSAELDKLDRSEGVPGLYERVLLPADVKWHQDWYTVPAWTYASHSWPVKLLVQPLTIDGLQAYHTSVRVGDQELGFDANGISSSSTAPVSGDSPAEDNLVVDMGTSQHSARELKDNLEKYFSPGTYDLLHKNCNSFSDAALAYLSNKRLDDKYRQLEQMGSQNPHLVEQTLGIPYTPNPKAADFNREKVVAEISGNAKEHAPSDRYARLVYCGLSERGISEDYVRDVKQHLENLGTPEGAFSCKAELLQPRLDLGSASQAGKVVSSGIDAASSIFLPPNSRKLQTNSKLGHRSRWHNFL